MKGKTHKPLRQTHYSLSSIFDFTPDDLAANEKGFATRRQLRRQYLYFLLVSIVFAMFMFLWLIFAAACTLVIYNALRGKIVLLILPGIPIFAVSSVFSWVCMRFFREQLKPLPQDLVSGRVENIKGTVRFHAGIKETFGAAYADYSISICGKRFPLLSSQFHRLENAIGRRQNQPYAFYYLPHSKRIISAHPIERDKDFWFENSV